jgi:NAD(P)-dependent dehydrogenase (short-subunit alcohol dehydrogenase family)
LETTVNSNGNRYSSSGIGFETSLTLARNGFFTYATMRNLEKSTKIKEIANKEALPLEVIQLDVDNDLSTKNAIQEIVSQKQRIDVVVNNAGYGLIGPIEDISIEEELKPQFETNLYGVVRVMQQVLPVMRRQESGRIINVSSIGGIAGYPFSAAYCSTKFALEGLCESLSYEVEQFGIKIILIEPALVISDFHTNVKMATKKGAANPDSSYAQMLQKLFEEYKQVEEQYKSPHMKFLNDNRVFLTKNPVKSNCCALSGLPSPEAYESPIETTSKSLTTTVLVTVLTCPLWSVTLSIT